MNPLDQLNDIHLPADISYWPPAYGWWLLCVVVALTVIFSVKAIIKFRRMRLAKRQALKQLAQFKHSDNDWPIELNKLYKRLVISYFPQEQVAGLYLDDWCAFLAAQLPDKSQTAFNEQMQTIQRYIYRPMGVAPDFISSMLQTELWIKQALPPRHHKVDNKELANV